VVLATLSTVVGLATGMFTLRDQVFPREAGTAAAVPVSVYEARVGRVCDELNASDRRRAREQKTIRRRLERATTTVSQRNALLDGVRRTVTRSADTLAAFTAIEAPDALAAARVDTIAAWGRNVARVRGYALRLDRSGTRGQLLAALDHLSTLRPRLARDGDRIVAGLRHIGADSCDLRPPKVTPAFSLPALRKKEVDTPDESSGSASPVQPAEGPGSSAPPTAGANTEVATTPSDVSANTPEADSPAVAAPDERGSTRSPDVSMPKIGASPGSGGDGDG
jgi:hypothetical protein